MDDEAAWHSTANSQEVRRSRLRGGHNRHKEAQQNRELSTLIMASHTYSAVVMSRSDRQRSRQAAIGSRHQTQIT